MTDYKLVPVEPTPEMLAEGEHALEAGCYASGIYADMLAAAPAVQGEPVAWSGWGCQYPGKMPRLYGERRIAELNCDWENGDQLLHFTATSQLTEQKPAPDVTQLVEALETCLEMEERPKIIKMARAALAPHRKQGGNP